MYYFFNLRYEQYINSILLLHMFTDLYIGIPGTVRVSVNIIHK